MQPLSPGQAPVAVLSVSVLCSVRGLLRAAPGTTAGAQPSLRSVLRFALDPPEQLRVWCGFPVPSSSTASLVLSHTLLQPHRPLGPGSRRERRRTQGAQPLLGPQLFPSERMFLLRALSTCRPPPLPPPAHTAGLPGAQRVQDSSPGGASPPQGSKGSWAPSELTPPPGSRPQSVLCACSPFSLV